jgi:hypothetical protein
LPDGLDNYRNCQFLLARGTRNPSLLHAATEEAGRMETIAAEVIAWAMALAAVAAAMVAAPAGQATRRISILGRTT